MTSISVIIPTYKDWNRLRLCLEALASQSFPLKDFEIIVVDNDIEHVVPIDLPRSANLKVINEPSPGSYTARNKGLGIADGNIIAFTDSDCIPDRDWLLNAFNKFEEDPSISRIAGNVELFYNDIDNLTIGEAYEMIFAFKQDTYAKQGRSVTANMITRKNVLDAVGLFNADMISGGDFEWSERATKAGFRIMYVPDVCVKHPARRYIKTILDKRRRVASKSAHVEKGSYLSNYFKFIYGLRPPLKDFISVFKKGRKLRLKQKIQVIFIRYYSNLVFAYWQLKAKNGALFDDRGTKN